MSYINLKPDPHTLKVYGTLAYVSAEERNRILDLPFGQFKPAIKLLEKQIKEAKKKKG